MRYASALETLLLTDPRRMNILHIVQSLCPESWIGAGFVRDAVWDHLHHSAPQPPAGDVDVIWLNSHAMEIEADIEMENRLRERAPDVEWSVKNQARMHLRNGDTPYSSLFAALWHWPETATAVAVRLAGKARIEIIAPFGLDDLFGLRLQPTPHFKGRKYPQFRRRVEEKRWLARYPHLALIAADDIPPGLC